MSRSFDFVVVGGGIVGLALANAVASRHSDATVCVLEKEDSLAAHASGRNSGVLHAGFYYAPDSLKARLTRHGNTLLRAFCAEAGVPVRECGKVVVAQNEGELEQLRSLLERGEANGVSLELVDEAQLKELEPLARTVDRALWSPNTAVSNPSAVVEALGRRVVARGGSLRLGSRVVGASPGKVTLSTGETISCGHLVNSAGLYADRVAHWFGVGTEYRMLPFKGLYWYGNWAPGTLKRHVYPVPDPRNPFLGVHMTVTVDGRAKVGPTAIPSMWREDYGGVHGFSVGEAAAIARTYPSFLFSPHHDVPGLIRTEMPKYRRQHLVKQAAALVPRVRPEDFTERGRPGVRAQLFDVKAKRLEMDFVVRAGDRSTHVLNAVSPAWTSSLAVASYVVESMEL